jgi:WD40 repeat protein
VVLTLRGHTDAVSSASFSPDGARIVTGSNDGTAKVWDAQSGAEVLTLKGHTNWVASASFSPDGARIVTASWDKTAKVWDSVPFKESQQAIANRLPAARKAGINP